jgi:hypothetical protein
MANMTSSQGRAIVNVVFRYDDVFLKGGSPDRDKLDLEVMKLFVEERVRLSVAVIPGDIRESEMSHEVPRGPVVYDSPTIPFILANRDLIEVCQHGYCHALASQGKDTEFAGRSAADQRADIDNGRALLEAASVGNVEVFVPPHNTFDQGTVDAAAAVGFRVICAGDSLYGTRLPADMAFVPMLTGLWGLEDAFAACARFNEVTYVTALFHIYDIKERRDSRALLALSELRAVLQRLKREPRVAFPTVSQAVAASPDRFNASTIKAYAVYRRLWRLHHFPLVKRLLLHRFVYHSSGVYWKHSAALSGLDALAIGLAAAVIGWARG